MKKFFTMIKLDFKLILQDKIALYMVLAPALLAFIFVAVTTGISEMSPKLAISGDIPEEITERLKEVADIEIYDDYSALERRVKGADSIAGIYMDNGELAILVEGNEKEGFAEENALLVDRALSEKRIAFNPIEVETTENLVLKISSASVILLAVLLAGAVSGINTVSERETGVIRALAVSPMGLVSYIGARTFTAEILGLANVVICTVIMGKSAQTAQFAAVALASLFIYGITALLIGSFASNQISAIAVMKVLMPVSLMLPIVSEFVPESLNILFYPLPMYWQYKGIAGILAGNGGAFPAYMALVTGGLWLAVILFLRGKEFGIRMEGVKS